VRRFEKPEKNNQIAYNRCLHRLSDKILLYRQAVASACFEAGFSFGCLHSHTYDNISSDLQFQA
jgi:hypothetical protein